MACPVCTGVQLVAAAVSLDAMQVLPLLLRHCEPELRAAAAFALACLIQVALPLLSCCGQEPTPICLSLGTAFCMLLGACVVPRQAEELGISAGGWG